jgi:hypothetical protein
MHAMASKSSPEQAKWGEKKSTVFKELAQRID